VKLFWGSTDYNLILEKILDSKYFSSNTKSLLLSMIYKIESFYADYQKIKCIEKTKEEFLDEILDDIKKYCDNIKLIEPDSDEAKILKENNLQALTNERERSILAYPTEVSLLYAISDVVPKYFYVPNDFAYKSAIQQLLVNGYNENNLELLTDFNGWSWDINVNVKHNIEDSIIYQNFMLLFGSTFMDEWMLQSDTKTNPLEDIKNYFKSTKYFDYLCKYLNLSLVGKDRISLDKQLDKKIKELEAISDKPKYLENVKNTKMKYLKEVEKIDILLNSKDAMRKEYMQKNAKLTPENRIPTIVDYKKRLENRRKVCIDKIAELTKLINPINYINHKQKLENFIENNSNIENKEDIIINIQKEFIKILKDKLFEIDDIELLKAYVYKIRYYRFLYINKEKQIKDIKELEIAINNVLKQIVKKLCDKEEIKVISKDEDFNFEIILNILDTKILDLSEIKFEIDIKDGIALIKTYEKETYEKNFEIPTKYTKKDLEIKTEKRYKLFI
jgi:hypothetical protein